MSEIGDVDYRLRTTKLHTNVDLYHRDGKLPHSLLENVLGYDNSNWQIRRT
jgi:hypothetical protein